MAVPIGLSPTDGVNLYRLVSRSIDAVRHQGGSVEQFKHTKQGLDSRIAALRKLEDYGTSTGEVDLANAAKGAREGDETATARNIEYEIAFQGGNATRKSQKVPKKLRWAFQGSRQTAEHLERADPSIDATLLQAIISHSTLVNTRHSETQSVLKSQYNDVVLGLKNNLDRSETGLKALEATIIRQMETEKREFRVLMTDAERRLQASLQADMAEVFRRLKDLKARPPRPTRRTTLRKQNTRKCPGRSTAKSTARTGLPVEGQSATQLSHFVQDITRYAWERASSDQARSMIRRAMTGIATLFPQPRQGPAGVDDDTVLLSKNLVLAVAFGIASCVAADDHQRKRLQKLVSRFADDPAFGLFALLSCFYFMQFLSSLPRQLSLLSDTSVLFQDPFGMHIRIPFLQCEQPLMFQAYLRHYFRDRPGLALIKRKRYVLLSGGRNGQLVTEEAWSKHVLPRTVLLMSMIVRSDAIKCPYCSVYLVVIPGRACTCPDCGRYISSISSDATENEPPSKTDERDQSSSQDDGGIKRNQENFDQGSKSSFVVPYEDPKPHAADQSEMVELGGGSSDDPKTVTGFKYLHILLRQQRSTLKAQTPAAESASDQVREGRFGGHRTIRLEQYLANNLPSSTKSREWAIISCHLIHDLARLHRAGKTTKVGHASSSATVDNITWETHFDVGEDAAKGHHFCPYPFCLDDFGLPKKYFSRSADVLRHIMHSHKSTTFDCPRRNCVRKGVAGFTIWEQLAEHLREYHVEDVRPRARRNWAANSLRYKIGVLDYGFQLVNNRADIFKLGEIMKKLALTPEWLPPWYSAVMELCVRPGLEWPSARELVRMVSDDLVPPEQRWWLNSGSGFIGRWIGE